MAAYSGSLAMAAAGRGSASNPFGLPGAGGTNTGGMGGYQGYQLLNPPQQPRGQQTQQNPTQTPVMPIPVVAASRSPR